MICSSRIWIWYSTVGQRFLHASLQLATLRECTNAHEVREALKAFASMSKRTTSAESAVVGMVWRKVQGPSKGPTMRACVGVAFVTIVLLRESCEAIFVLNLVRLRDSGSRGKSLDVREKKRTHKFMDRSRTSASSRCDGETASSYRSLQALIVRADEGIAGWKLGRWVPGRVGLTMIHSASCRCNACDKERTFRCCSARR